MLRKLKMTSPKIYVLLASLLFCLSSTGVAIADGPALPGGTTAPAAPTQSQQPGGILAFAPFILMFGVLYLLVLRPQQKKVKEQQALLSSLKHGDEVITTSGMLGKVTGITDKVVTLEVADEVRVKMLKSQVSQIVKGQIKDLAQ